MNSTAYQNVMRNHLEWLIHAFIWTFIIAERWINHYIVAYHPVIYGIYQTILLLGCFIIPIYINALILIPSFFKKSKWVQYAILLVTMMLLVNITRGIVTIIFFQLVGFKYDFFTEFMKWSFSDYASFDRFLFSPTAWVLWVSFTYRLIKDWFIYERVKSTLETEKVAMELAFLKSQVDPHFLFNTLNNIYALALEERADRTADGVAKMGTLMRYTLHDSQADYILLQKEISYIEKYIELQRIRIAEGSNVKIETNFDISQVSNERIAPMMLIPFIENAFKYGISMVAPSYIVIDLKVEGKNLMLRVQNSIHELQKAEQGGIGLKNVQNRLWLLYANRHRLECKIINHEYTVHLDLDLKDD